MLSRSAGMFALLITLASLPGCGGPSKPANPTCYPVSGQLTYNGQPTKGAVIQFWPLPIDRNNWQTRKPSAQIAEDGSFKVWTYETNDGAPSGEYAVTLIWDSNGGDNPPGADAFQGRYANPDQPITKVKVDSNPNEMPPIALTGPAVTPPGGG